jgi:hypothetical protein
LVISVIWSGCPPLSDYANRGDEMPPSVETIPRFRRR